MQKMKSSTDSKELKSKRYYLVLNRDELLTFNTMSKTLGMSKSKIVRHMILKNSGYILCNTVEAMKTLDLLGLELTQMQNIIQPLVLKYTNNDSQKLFNIEDVSQEKMILIEYFNIQAKIEQAMRGLLNTIKLMK